MASDSSFGLYPDIGQYDWKPTMDRIVFGHSGGISITEAKLEPRITWGPLVTSGDGRPRWSPDGTKIAFGYSQILTMDPDGTNVTVIVPFQNIYHKPGTHCDHNWSAHVTHLAYNRQ